MSIELLEERSGTETSKRHKTSFVNIRRLTPQKIAYTENATKILYAV